MKDIDKVEMILVDALSDYEKKNMLTISSVENGVFSDQHERSNGLTITLNNGQVFNVLIFEVAG